MEQTFQEELRITFSVQSKGLVATRVTDGENRNGWELHFIWKVAGIYPKLKVLFTR